MTQKEMMITLILHELSEKNCFKTLETLARKQLNDMTEKELKEFKKSTLTFGRAGF